jgi:hypothetical protein
MSAPVKLGDVFEYPDGIRGTVVHVAPSFVHLRIEDSDRAGRDRNFLASLSPDALTSPRCALRRVTPETPRSS